MRIVAALCGLALVSCGRGVKNYATGIHLDAVTTAVVAGGPSVSLTANVSGTSDAVTWTLDGPGALSQARGATTAYAPPPCATQTTTATVTASAGGAQASVTFEIQPKANAVCLSITPQQGEVTIGQGTLTLTATGSAASDDVSWTVYGPGTLSGSKGTSVAYSPPEALGYDQETSVTVTASAGSAAVARASVRVIPRPVITLGEPIISLAFDGANLWAGGLTSHLYKVRVSDGTLLAAYTYSCGFGGLLAENGYVWATTIEQKPRLLKIRGSDGDIVASALPTIGWQPAMLFDGSAIWISAGEGLLKLSEDDGHLLLDIPAPATTFLVTDGSRMWGFSQALQSLTRFRMSDGANLGNLYAGGSVISGFIDGDGILWAVLYHNNSHPTLLRVDTAAGVVLGSTDFPSIFDSSGVALIPDGSSLWTLGPQRVIKFSKSDLAVEQNSFVSGARAMAFDGVHMWVGSYNGYVTRL